MDYFLSAHYLLVATLMVVVLWIAVVKFGPMRRL